MNRNQMYDYLKSKGMYPIFVWRDNGKSYHTEFRLNNDKNQTDCMIVTDWGYIRHIYSIHLCADEIVIEAYMDRMKINIYYKDIEKFEVKIEEE